MNSIDLQYATPVRPSRRDVFGPIGLLCGLLHLACFMGFRYAADGDWTGFVVLLGATFGTLAIGFSVVAIVTTRGRSIFAWVTVALYAVVMSAHGVGFL